GAKLVLAARNEDALRQLTEEIKAQLAQEFPSEFADYHRGAFAWRMGKLEEARAAWEALLKRPAEERRYRTTWAMFMLGKDASREGNWERASEYFKQTRQAVREGFADTMKLAASSFGWEARMNLEAKRFSEAAGLYLEQLASGDSSAVFSLRDVMTGVFVEGADLEAVVKDPVLQRLATACSVAALGPFSEGNNFEAGDQSLSARWLTALEKVDAKNVRDADRVAWIAYAGGDYARAERWLRRAEETSPYTLWLKAKLSLRKGDVKTATQLLSKALRMLPENQDLESRGFVEDEMPPRIVAQGDLGLLQFTRGDFMNALKLFVEGGHRNDAEYIAEGILTIKELKGFVDEQA
ncbi:MAG: tetratricopeptide repeat protein, partial [Verrucomicrobiaceae bacterium]